MDINKRILFGGLIGLALVFYFYTWYQDSKKFAPGADLKSFKTQGEFGRYYKNLEKYNNGQ